MKLIDLLGADLYPELGKDHYGNTLHGKQNTPYYIQWLNGSFFRLEPPGFQSVGSTVSWRWIHIPRIDQKICVLWYA
ncbi:hypothetical protein [Methylacidiphilum caldifontis]|uniref:hypothetical protein n=1 Tax=Methylacidiphilum caldifontis TaxID=2795386 RepID=UPI001FC9D649|nr:hypothetical protein [Methylacidiphilum caldifontis]